MFIVTWVECEYVSSLGVENTLDNVTNDVEESILVQ